MSWSKYWDEGLPPYPLPDALKAQWDKAIPGMKGRFLSDEEKWHLHEWKKRQIWMCGDCIEYGNRICEKHALEVGCYSCKSLHRLGVFCTREELGWSSSSKVDVPEAVKFWEKNNDAI